MIVEPTSKLMASRWHPSSITLPPALLPSECVARQRSRRLHPESHELSTGNEREVADQEPRRHKMDAELADLAHGNRVETMGCLAASITHELNQPIATAVTHAEAALRWLSADPPNLNEVRRSLRDIVKVCRRAGDLVGHMRAFITKAPRWQDGLGINEMILEVIGLARGEVATNRVAVQTELAEDLPPIRGDRVQLQQVVLNLIVNAVEAMGGASEGPRELRISTAKVDSGGVLVTVRDSGPGVSPTSLKRVFEAFYTTKPGGLGMGLAICSSIVDAHAGRLWVTANALRGAAFQFTLPGQVDSAS
jgi:C4-dicarboxylate-specific signal transduction histidine kinase